MSMLCTRPEDIWLWWVLTLDIYSADIYDMSSTRETRILAENHARQIGSEG